jgi:O-antigen ligase
MIPLFIFGADFVKKNDPKPILLLVIATQLSLTVSRGAYAGALLGLIILIIFAMRWKVKIQRIISLSALMIGGIIFAYLLTGLEVVRPAKPQEKSEHKTKAIVQQATNFDTQSDRDLNRELAGQAFSENPLLGIGPGGIDKYLRVNAEIYQGTDGKLIANNETLELLAEGGLLSFLALVFSLLWMVWVSLRSIWTANHESPQWPGMVGLLCYLVGLAAQYQTFSTLYIMHVWVAIGILMGCIRIAESQSKTSPASKKPKTKRNAKKA